ncbi:MAG: hypothetical protein GEV03_18350, partial [Streptosporangiales bacterium]|nr:hypothetical protein [Streptosporangiales bacterium]
MCSPSETSVAGALTGIRQALTVLAGHDPAGAPVAAVAEQLRELRGLIDGLELESCRRLARFDAARGFEAEEAR